MANRYSHLLRIKDLWSLEDREKLLTIPLRNLIFDKSDSLVDKIMQGLSLPEHPDVSNRVRQKLHHVIFFLFCK